MTRTLGAPLKVRRLAPHDADAFGRGEGASLVAGFDAVLLPLDAGQAPGEAGVAVLYDVDLGTLSTDNPLVQAHPNAFVVSRVHNSDAPIDPRAPQAGAGEARVRRGALETGVLLDWAVERLGPALRSGAKGFHFRALERFEPRFWRGLVERLRSVAPNLLLIAGTTGVARAAAAELEGCGFDYATSSLAWWDGRASWLVEELEALGRVAPLLADFGVASVAQPERALRLAAALGWGWVAPDGVDAAQAGSADRLLDSLRRFGGEVRALTGPGAGVTAILRAGAPDLRVADEALLVLVNPDLGASAQVSGDDLGPLGRAFANYSRVEGKGQPFAPLAAGEVRLLASVRAKPILVGAKAGKQAARAASEAPRIAIEALSPGVDGGRFAVKRTVGDAVTVEADIFADGHEQLAAELLWRPADAKDWRAVRMSLVVNDRWRGEFTPERMGRHLFAVEAWLDVFGGFRRDLSKKLDAGVATPVDLQEGRALVQAASERSDGALREALRETLAGLDAMGEEHLPGLLLSPELATLMDRADDRPFRTVSEVQPLEAERLGARFASWYELFPRSQTDDPARHGTFDDVIARLPAVRAMGFDVLYFPPIHPIGRKNRKGANNSLTAEPGEPGSPYAIGAEEGGHDAVHPELGGIEGFDRLVAAAHDHGLEIALDFAVQCAPDHPWLKEHPGWFDYRPDGSIKYAENPPKKYQDIVNVDFYKPDSVPGLWLALRDAVLFWAEHGVRLFRVDNPHTKPLPFWEWMIADVRARYPDTVFLAEAFTRPKPMYRLAKIGFSQSYTYFTWRHTKAELTEYLTELTTTAPKEFFRPHFFVNTPDINPYFLQTSGRAGFLIRAALAATLSGLFGVYSGFELLEADPIPGKEEYKDSEKYQIRIRDWKQPGNIVAEITRLNLIRKANPALQTHLGVSFYNAFNDNVLYFGKTTAAKDDMVLVAINLDPHNAQSFDFEIPLWEWGLPDDGALEVEDLLRDRRFTWRGKRQHLTLAPDQPYAIWRVQPARQA